MQVETNNRLDAVHGVTQTLYPALGPSQPEVLIDFQDVQALTLALKRQEDVREAEVEKALNLIGQVEWPPAETIRRITSLLAAKMNSLTPY